MCECVCVRVCCPCVCVCLCVFYVSLAMLLCFFVDSHFLPLFFLSSSPFLPPISRERRDREGKESAESRDASDNFRDLEPDPRSSCTESGGPGSTKAKQFDVKCVMQRVQMTTGDLRCFKMF